MDSLRLPIAMLVFVLLATACTPGTGDRAATQVPVTVTVSGGTPNAPTAVPGSTPLPWWEGRFIGQIGGEGTEWGQFREPVGLALGPDGDLYVADQGNRRVQVLSVGGDGTLTPKAAWPVQAWAHNEMAYKPYICVPGDRVFITDPEAGSVQEYAAGGEFVRAYDLNHTGYLNYGFVYGIAADPGGALWVSDLAGGAGVLVKIYPLP